MAKRKSKGRRGEPLSLELDEEQMEVLELLPDLLHPSLKCLVPVLDSIRKAYSVVTPTHTRVLPVSTSSPHDHGTILIF